MTFAYTCPLGHKAGSVRVADNWYQATLYAATPADRERLTAPPQVHCPHCGASCHVRRSLEGRNIRRAA